MNLEEANAIEFIEKLNDRIKDPRIVYSYKVDDEITSTAIAEVKLSLLDREAIIKIPQNRKSSLGELAAQLYRLCLQRLYLPVVQELVHPGIPRFLGSLDPSSKQYWGDFLSSYLDETYHFGSLRDAGGYIAVPTQFVRDHVKVFEHILNASCNLEESDFLEEKFVFARFGSKWRTFGENVNCLIVVSDLYQYNFVNLIDFCRVDQSDRDLSGAILIVLE